MCLIASAIAFTFTFAACSDEEENVTDNGSDNNNGNDNDNTPKDSTENQIANKWIYDEMKTWYYWNDKIADESSLDFNLDPDVTNGFFNSILYTGTKYNADNDKNQLRALYDKFSWIESYTANAKAALAIDLGFDFIPAYGNEAETKVVFIISYVKPNTWAANNGIKRGFIINKVDNSELTLSNWSSALYQNKSSYTLEYAKNSSDYNNDIYSTIVLQRTPNYEDKPVMIDTIYTVGSHKIGYMVFNTYGSDADQNDLNDNIYMIERLQNFTDQGITDLVLDLRYNGGGLVTTGVHLGSALVPNRDVTKVYEKKKYNSLIQAELDAMPEGYYLKESYLYDYFRNNIKWNNNTYNDIPKLGDQLQTLCIIGTDYTASASEMTINCLKPYYAQAGKNLYLIGWQTVGKNVGSWTFEPDDSRIKWKLQPITFQSSNVNGESGYFDGFIPDVKIDDFKDLRTGLKELGDQDETLLAAAIAKITGASVVDTSTKSAASDKFKRLPLSQLEKGGRQFRMIEDPYKVKEIVNKTNLLKTAK